MGSSTLGLFRPGSSLLHRMTPGGKLLILIAVGVASVWLQKDWRVVVAAAVVSVSLYLLAGFGPLIAWQQVKPMFFILGFTAAFHVIITGWRAAISITGMILVLVLMAALVTLTTRTTALIDTIVRALRPLERFGLDPDRVGMALLLGMRCVPLVSQMAGQVREAQIARTGAFSVRAFAVPLIVRALRDADAMGEALVARGVDDD